MHHQTESNLPAEFKRRWHKYREKSKLMAFQNVSKLLKKNLPAECMSSENAFGEENKPLTPLFQNAPTLYKKLTYQLITRVENGSKRERANHV